jgi:hypothetical protein
MFQPKNALKHLKKAFSGQHNQFRDQQGLSWTKKMAIMIFSEENYQ